MRTPEKSLTPRIIISPQYQYIVHPRGKLKAIMVASLSVVVILYHIFCGKKFYFDLDPLIFLTVNEKEWISRDGLRREQEETNLVRPVRP